MDALERDDLERMQRTSPEEKLRQALEMMRAGFRLKLDALRRDHRDLSDEEVTALFRQWLIADDDR